MSVEKHAEALVNDLLQPGSLTKILEISVRHMQSAIDETTIGHAAMIAKYTERIDELETLNNGYRLRCHTAEMSAAGSKEAIEQWRELDTVLRGRLDKAKARIAKLEGLGPLIEEYANCCADFARYNAGDSGGDLWKKIDSILKGES